MRAGTNEPPWPADLRWVLARHLTILHDGRPGAVYTEIHCALHAKRDDHDTANARANAWHSSPCREA
jgi:hypothetical protein